MANTTIEPIRIPVGIKVDGEWHEIGTVEIPITVGEVLRPSAPWYPTTTPTIRHDQIICNADDAKRVAATIANDTLKYISVR